MTALWPDTSWLTNKLQKDGLFVWVGGRDQPVVFAVAGREWGRQVRLTQSEKGGDWRVELYVNGTPKRGVLGVPLDEVVSTTRELLEEEG